MSSGKLSGRTALVTGGSRGIGRGIAIELAQAGAFVAVNYTGHEEAARDTVAAIEAAGGRAAAFRADVGQPGEAAALADRVAAACGGLDILVNNAGICPFADFFDIDEPTWRQTIDVNLGGAFFCSQAAARHMRETGGGAILHIGTVTSLRGGVKQVHYAASKGGINGLTSSMANALGGYGIRVNAILCGGVPTDINREQTGGAQAGAPAKIPAGRTGMPADLGKAAVYLCSADSEWVTGALLAVDGGSLVM